MSCAVESVNYTTIVCETQCDLPPANCPVGGMSPTILVPASGGVVSAECEGAGCRFITSVADTATVSSVSPLTVDAGQSMCHVKNIVIWPSGKLPFDCQKIAKNLTFLKKNCQNCIFLKIQFWQLKKVKFLAIFWHLNGNFPEGQNPINVFFQRTTVVGGVLLFSVRC